MLKYSDFRPFTIEYKVVPVTRYVVTCVTTTEGYYDKSSPLVQTEKFYELADEQRAYEIAQSMCEDEQQRWGFPPGDERIKYPEPPSKEAVKVTDYSESEAR